MSHKMTRELAHRLVSDYADANQSAIRLLDKGTDEQYVEALDKAARARKVLVDAMNQATS